jgi:U32 family peptidase
MVKPEILAPLNGWKSLSPDMNVLENGDAFYFGLKTKFTMRARADNFPIEDLDKLVKMIHDVSKKCYLTLNTIVYDEELVELHQTIELAKNAGVDAIICHDMASIMIAKELNIPFHISTQMNISNQITAKFFESMGAERIILARELDLDQIKHIISQVEIPIECFIHGAMCTAISGRCYFSTNVMGNNPEFSANRGRCVQPCRRSWKTTFVGEEGEQIDYDERVGMFFSAKDLCMIEHIPQLVEAGIKSFKIEGRMRDPLYIGEVVKCYREAIDSYYALTYKPKKVQGWVVRLNTVFNRGFHTGFYFTRPNSDEIQRNVAGNASDYHKVMVGVVKNYFKKACAVEIELYQKQLHVDQEIIFENQSDYFHKEKISSMQLDDKPIIETDFANSNNHILVGIKVNQPVPKNSKVFIIEQRNQESESNN